MAEPSQPAPAADERRETPRVQLARAATAVALADPAVTGLDAGATTSRTTFAGTEPLPGVTVLANEGGYDIALYVTARPTDLRALGAQLEHRLRRAAEVSDLDVNEIHVTFTDLTLPDEGARS